MKCVRFVGQGVPHRLSDADAFQIVVRDKDGEYCSKRFWRDWYAKGDASYAEAEDIRVAAIRAKLDSQTKGRRRYA